MHVKLHLSGAEPTHPECQIAAHTCCYTALVMVDASPLIYLAKLDALDVFARAGHVPYVTPEVERETARAGLAYRYPGRLGDRGGDP